MTAILSWGNCLSQDLNIRVYGVQDGLSQSEVNTINQDHLRNLWLGTSSGLSKFDGQTFTTLKKEDGLAGDVIYSSYQDEENNLWLGHYGGVISRINLNDESIRTYTLPIDSSTLNTSYIIRIFPETSGNLLFITYENGIFSFNKNTGKFKQIIHKSIYDACIDKQNHLWYTNAENVFYRDLQTGEEDSLDLRGIIKPDRILCLFCDHENTMWMGSNKNNLLYWNENLFPGKKPKKINLNLPNVSFNITSMYEDRNRKLWLNTYYGGVVKFDPETRNDKKPVFTSILTRNGLSLNNTTVTFEDAEANYWIGTHGGGLCQYRDDSFKLFTSKNGLADNLIWKIVSDDYGYLWISGDEGLNKFINPNDNELQPQIKKFTTVSNEDPHAKIKKEKLIQVLTIYKDQHGFIWGTYLDGIFRVNPKNDHFKFYKFDADDLFAVTAIAEDAKGRLLIGTIENGIYTIDKKKDKLVRFATPGIDKNQTASFYRDKDHNLWIGGVGSFLYKYDGETFKPFTAPFHSIMAMDQDTKGNLWIIGDDHELFKFDGTGFKKIDLHYAREKETIYSIKCDDSGNIWLGLTFGLLKLNPVNMQTQHFGKLSGFSILESNQGSVYKDKKGNMWFGTTGGLIKVTPAGLKKNLLAPVCSISGIKLFDKPVKITPEITFEHNENYLTFDFLGISLTNPEHVSYRYQLTGLGKGWSSTGYENHITFANLTPGNYTLQVEAANNDGIWSDNPVSINFAILAPFWQRTWFILLTIIILAITIFTLHKRRIRKIEERNLYLDIKIKERTVELKEAKEAAELSAEAFKESESKFRNLTEMTSVAIFIYVGEEFRYVNPAMESITGYSRSELLSMKFWNIVHPDHREMTKERGMKRQRGEEVPSHYQIKVLRKDKESRWVDFIAKQISYEGRLAALGTAVDITDLKDTHRELISQREQLRITLKSIGDGVITTTTDGKIRMLNREAENLTGWKQEDALDKNISEVFHVIDSRTKKVIEDPVTSFIRKNDFSNLEGQFSILSKDKREIIIAENGSPIKNDQGKVIGYVIVFRDIGETIKLQKEILKRQKLDSVGVLAGGLAHDFNNILTAISGNLSLAELYTESNKELQNILKDAEIASERARDITQQLLTFSKGGSPVKETASINVIISESIGFTLRGSSVGCKYLFPEDLWPVSVDGGQISQVIQNLTLNSMQAMPDGGRIQVTAKNRIIRKDHGIPVIPGKYVEIKFKDDGHGIPEDMINKIFDPYFTTKEKGIGLGLASVYSIIRKHDGYITVNSKTGHGTSFIIYLPKAETLEQVKEVEDDHTTGNSNPGKILFMDDEDIVRDVAKKMLESLGHPVLLAKNGKEAIRMFKKEQKTGMPVEMVILDLTIPGGMGGKETMENLLRIDPGIKAVVASGYSNDDVMANFKTYGFRARVQKPFKLKDLEYAIKSI